MQTCMLHRASVGIVEMAIWQRCEPGSIGQTIARLTAEPGIMSSSQLGYTLVMEIDQEIISRYDIYSVDWAVKLQQISKRHCMLDVSHS